MRERNPMTQTIKASDVRQQWSDILNKVFRKETQVIVEKSGIPVAAIISTDDLARLQRLEAERNKDFALIDEMRAAFADVPEAELEQETTNALTDVREEKRKQPSRHIP
jgi:prevent-host-death family protein